MRIRHRQSVSLIRHALPAALLLAGLLMARAVLAQQTATPAAPVTPAVQPTSAFDLNRPPTIGAQLVATIPPSQTGVNGYAQFAPVSIRSGPGLEYPRIGALAQGRSVDIIGYNGYSLDRPCTVNFEADLDMWVLVQWRGQEGWMARCALRITGERNMAQMIRNVPPPGAPLPTGYPTPAPTPAG